MSGTRGDPGDAVVGASRVGAELRAARQRLGWGLPDVAANLRIRLAFLEAIEDGRVADLPGNAYAVGFIRTYATSLGLDAAEIARRFRMEAQEVNRKTDLAFPAPVPERGAPAGALVLLGVLLAAGAYAGWYHYSGQARPSPGVAAVPERLETLAERAPPSPPSGPAVPSSPSPQVASVMPGPAAFTPPASTPPVTFTPPAVSTPPAAPLPSAASPPAAPAEADESRIVLRAKSDAWVQVRERQGQVLLNRVMRGGETWTVPRGGLLLTTGNAGNTELLLDGQPTPSLGPAGAVRRDVALEPDALRPGPTAQTQPR